MSSSSAPKSHTHVRGPISLTEHVSAEHKKHIYIFGESHYGAAVCPPEAKVVAVEDLIRATIEANMDKVIDVFVEFPYYDKWWEDGLDKIPYRLRKESEDEDEKEEPHDESVTKIISLLSACFVKWKLTGNAYSNVRAHATDIRATMKSVFAGFMNEVMMNIKDAGEATLAGINRIVSMLFRVKDISELKGVQTRLELKIKEDKIVKQLDNIADSKVKSTIVKYFNDANEKIDMKYDHIYALYDMVKRAKRGEIEDPGSMFLPYLNCYSRLTNYCMLYMDIYAMGRVFRNFRQVAGKYSAPPQHIIIYCGEGHARNYRGLLSLLGFTAVKEAYSSEKFCAEKTPKANGKYTNKCIDMSGFKQPFFS